jgi:Tfp pilus assembly protein PilV
MEPIELVPKNSQRQGIPLWAALAALLVLAVSSIAVLAYVLNKATNDKARLERQAQNWELEKAKVEIDRQKAEYDAIEPKDFLIVGPAVTAYAKPSLFRNRG